MSLRKKNCSHITLAKKSWGECWTSSRGDGGNRGERILRNTRRKCYSSESGGSPLIGRKRLKEQKVRLENDGVKRCSVLR